jgi:DNA-binding transcriptional ArsR family regulator
MLMKNPEDQIAQILKALGQNIRILIVVIIGDQETCVCHLEAILGIRQARISQHLMALRKAGIVTTKRDGRHIYYRLVNPEILDVICRAAEILQFNPDQLKDFSNQTNLNCTCPRCIQELDPTLICKPNQSSKNK